MKNELVNLLANHFVECFKIKANTDYTFDASSNDAVNELRTDLVEEATDMLFSPSFRKETESMTNEQYMKYLKKIEQETKSIMHHDKTDSPCDTPEDEQDGDSFLGNATNS